MKPDDITKRSRFSQLGTSGQALLLPFCRRRKIVNAQRGGRI